MQLAIMRSNAQTLDPASLLNVLAPVVNKPPGIHWTRTSGRTWRVEVVR